MSNRTKRFTKSLLTGYGTIGVNIITSLLSVPLALVYLSKEEFGLWALALQINGYLSLVDIGMTGAIGRYLADHKDDVNGNGFTEHFATGSCVFLIQAILVAFLGVIFSEYAPKLLSIQSELTEEFTLLLRILCLITGLSIAFRAFGAPLWAFQRMDVVNIAALIGLIVQFFSMWLGFHLGYGVLSFAFASVLPTIIAPIFYVVACKKNSYYPTCKDWFIPKWSVFLEMFHYGKDSMLLSIGSQMVNATQITIISRILGLNAAASFSIATKLYGLITMLIHKIIESAAPGLAEMFVRGERELFIKRYWDIIAITLALSTIGAVAIVVGNSVFIEIWTGGKITWSLTGDILLGFMIILTSASRCFVGLFGVTKNLKSVRLIYFIEGLLFIPTAICAVHWYGIEGVIFASLFVHLITAVAPSLRAASIFLGDCRRLIPQILVILIMISLGTTLAFFTRSNHVSPVIQLLIAALSILCAILISWKFTLPLNIREKIINASYRWLTKYLFTSLKR